MRVAELCTSSGFLIDSASLSASHSLKLWRAIEFRALKRPWALPFYTASGESVLVDRAFEDHWKFNARRSRNECKQLIRLVSRIAILVSYVFKLPKASTISFRMDGGKPAGL